MHTSLSRLLFHSLRSSFVRLPARLTMDFGLSVFYFTLCNWSRAARAVLRPHRAERSIRARARSAELSRPGRPTSHWSSVVRASMSPEGVTFDRESVHVFLVCVELASGTLGLLPGYGVRPKLRPDCSAEAVLRATPRLSYAKRTRLLNTVDST